ncbi:hypothetical protein ACRAOD_16650 [Raoultella ornithinolytica]|uniref:hypothetical protein n=1 Tax=Raoultella ornithinolytica TaxID=54291 RepID=UPI0021BAC576|nr:hypothetical protein [Raoultella ornithinolytica]MCT8171514.1 hypothetical protein [Raoultella ornithinolytica]HDS7794633.1 hypothetical protein [Raoultella ornithinolytica]
MSMELIKNESFISSSSEGLSIKNNGYLSPDIKIRSNEGYVINRKNVTEVFFNLTKNNIDGKANGDFQLGQLGLTSSKETKKIIDRVFNLFSLERIELGCESKTSNLINELINEYGFEFVDMALAQLMRNHIINSGRPMVMCKFLTLLTELDVKFIPTTSSYAITSFSHKKYNSVKEMILVAIELWKNKDALRLLEDMEPYNRRHLEEYRLKIIDMLKGV